MERDRKTDPTSGRLTAAQDIHANRWPRDLLFFGIAAVGILVLFLWLEPFELLHELSRNVEHFELDEVIFASLPISLFLTWFAYRRWQDFAVELDRRIATEDKLQEINETLEQRIEERTAAHTASEEAATKAHRRLLDTIESMDNGFALFDHNDRLALYNQQFTAMFPLIADLIQPGAHFEALAWAMTERHQNVDSVTDPTDWVQRRLEIRKKQTGVFIHQMANGKWILVNSHRTADGQTMSNYVDITALKQTEEQLRASEEQLRLITDAMPVLIGYVDDTQHYRFINKIAEEWHKRPRAQTIGKTMKEILAKGVYQKVRPQIEAALSGTEVSFEGKFAFADGARRYVRVNYIPHFDNGQKVRGFFALAEDITEQKETEARLHQAQKSEAIGQLTGGVAHDFNNLLGIILGNIELLQEDAVERGASENLIAAALSATLRGKELTQRLLAFARQQPLNPQATNLNALASTTMELLRRTLEESVEIETVLAGGLWEAMVDPNQLENALINLAINARDAMPSGGKLTVETANVRLDDAYARENTEVRSGQYVMLAVTDTGVGMASGVETRVFDPFFTTKEVGKGSGLGLSMVYGFVKQSGGHVKIYTEEGAGTSVKLYLPKSISRMEPARPRENREAKIQLEGKTILVVEDAEDLRNVAVALLENLGCKVFAAESGPKALTILDETPEIELLFTDIVLPDGMNGVELARKAQVRRPDLRILYTSGYTENAIVHQGKLDSGVHLLDKPYRKADLARKIQAVFDIN